MYGRRRRRPGFWPSPRKRKHRNTWQRSRFSYRGSWRKRVFLFPSGRKGNLAESSPVLLMCLFTAGLFLGSIIYWCSGSLIEWTGLDNPPARMGNEQFAVALGHEVNQTVADQYSLDAQLPKVISSYASADQLGAEIAGDFWYVLDPHAAAIREAFYGWKNPQITIRYEVEERGGQFVITVTLTLVSDHSGTKQIMTYQYGYDVKKREKIIFTQPQPRIKIE